MLNVHLEEPQPARVGRHRSRHSSDLQSLPERSADDAALRRDLPVYPSRASKAVSLVEKYRLEVYQRRPVEVLALD